MSNKSCQLLSLALEPISETSTRVHLVRALSYGQINHLKFATDAELFGSLVKVLEEGIMMVRTGMN